MKQPLTHHTHDSEKTSKGQKQPHAFSSPFNSSALCKFLDFQIRTVSPPSDAFPILKNACSDTGFIEQLVIFCAVLTFIATLVCIVLSYIYIIRTVLRLPSAQERKKAFSTCSSHMIVVSITYGSCIFMYVKPSAKDEVAHNKGVSLLTTSIAPMLNPFVYTLRNKQVKQSFHGILKRLIFYSRKQQNITPETLK